MAGGGHCVLGVDLGTTNAKAVAYTTDGTVVASAERRVALTAEQGRAEQDPDAVLAAAADAVAEVGAALGHSGHGVVAAGFSGALHSLLAADGGGRPLTPALTWADARAAAQAAQLAGDAGELARRTGTPVHPMAPLAKLRWFAQERPDVAARARRWLSLKEYVLLQLTGEALVDHSIASATGLFDLEKRAWDGDALGLAGVTREQLSAPVPMVTRVGPLRDDWPQRLGLPAGLPLVIGAGDGPLANLGTGAVEPGVAALTVGTSGAVRLLVDSPSGDRTGRLFCYACTDDSWAVGGAVSNGGIVVDWARRHLLPAPDGYADVERLAAGAPAGAGGLLFLPHLVGERAPRWDPALRAVLFGLTAQHGIAHITRALLEGVALHLATVVAALEDAGQAVGAVRASGGFTRSPLWLQITADVLGRPLLVPERAEGSPAGAALLALEAMGQGHARDLALRWAGPVRTVEPDAARAATYRELLAIYQRLEDALQPEFAALARAANPGHDVLR